MTALAAAAEAMQIMAASAVWRRLVPTRRLELDRFMNLLPSPGMVL
jgi:hypothetical protein